MAINLPHINEEQEQPNAEATEGQEETKWNYSQHFVMHLEKFHFSLSLKIFM